LISASLRAKSGGQRELWSQQLLQSSYRLLLHHLLHVDLREVQQLLVKMVKAMLTQCSRAVAAAVAQPQPSLMLKLLATAALIILQQT